MNFKSWQDFFARLISPMMIGFYITMAMVWLTVGYYSLSARDDRQGLTSIIKTAHEKTFDYRLRLRGPRPVSKNLALLTIDERSLATVGRWPWPRQTLAKAVDRAFQYGAKILAFDMVFPEAQQNPVQMIEDQARANGHLDPALQASLSTYKEALDGDRALGAAFARHADQIVAGSFAASQPDSYAAETEFCHDLIFKRSAAAKQWDKEEVLLSVNDAYLSTVPSLILESTNAALQEIETATREKLGAPKDRNEAVLNDRQVQAALYELCGSILTDLHDPFSEQWANVVAQENNKDFKFPTYDAWLADFRQHSYRNTIISKEDWSLNTPVIAQGTKHTAHFNTEQDSDGTIRSKALVVRTGDSYFPALALKAYLVANKFNAGPRLDVNAGSGNKEVIDLEVTNNETGDSVEHIPVDRQSRLVINYAGPQYMYPYFSFADLLSDSPDADIEQRVYDPKTKRWDVLTTRVKKAEFLKDKIFVVGATAIGIYDLRVTPFQENYPGAETHLNALDNIQTKKYFRTFPLEYAYMPIFLAILGLSLSVVLSYLGAISGLAVTVAGLVGTWYVDQIYLFGQGWIVTIIWPLSLIMFLYVSLTFYRYLTEERGKKELRQTFQKYVSPAIVEEILSDPKNIALGGKKVHLTVMFSDVRGFTTISEKLDPEALSDLLNSYLTPMTEIVFKNQGTLDKYMGDAIMSFFGAPIAYKDHAKHACRCALQSVEKLFVLQKEYERKGLPTIDLGIGLNTGDVSVGNMGSETVRSYTVMGDAVNLASRLEGINKQYGTRIILSEMTYQEVKDSFICREVDWVRVKGKLLPVKIYELMAEGTLPNPQAAEMLKWFNEGYGHYHTKSWRDGLACFSKALDLVPTDEVSKLYIERCQDYLDNPPDDTWDGVFVMKTK